MIISDSQLWIGILLIIFNALLTFVLQLNMAKSILWTSLRGCCQLILLGLALDWIFSHPSPWIVLLIAVAMFLIASRTAISRCGYRFPGMLMQNSIAMGVSTFISLFIGLSCIVHADPWYAPNVAIPLMGMLIGNTLNAVGLCLDRLLNDLKKDQSLIETKLSLGATRWEAALPTLSKSIQTGLVPIMNLMTVVGVVSLPGTMTGLVLAGTDALSAVKFQFLIIVLIMTCSILATSMTAMWTFHRFFNQSHQLNSGLLWKKS